MKKGIFLLCCICLSFVANCQQADSLKISRDSLNKVKDTVAVSGDSAIKPGITDTYHPLLQELISANRVLKADRQGVVMPNFEKRPSSQDWMFYLLLAVLAILAFFRYFYTRYFNNLFRVFFNTSLRQSQLTDQLLQAKLPSLFFNLLFVITGGIYIFFLMQYQHWIRPANPVNTLAICILSVGGLYFAKYLTLGFTGWITGYREATNTYAFIIFLINKILGIMLVPVIIMMAFSPGFIVNAVVLISAIVIGLMFLLRFARSYSLLQHQLKVSRFHFFLYIIGVELLPLLLIYKGLVVLLIKNG